MQLKGARALITGGAGGIGRAIAVGLLDRGADALLVDRDERGLRAAQQSMSPYGGRVETFTADLTSAADRQRLRTFAGQWHGGIDILINNAGLNHFRWFEEQPAEQIDLAIAVNVLAPMHLCRDLLPVLGARPAACIVNTGSVFGAIGYPGYVTYSTTKFALRGFSEALRRELAGTSVSVHYLAPRATRTPINSSAVEQMNAELGVAMDPPERVAAEVCSLIERGRAEGVVGWPEKLFARLNAVAPRLVDGAIRRQLPVIRRYASRPEIVLADTRRKAS